MRKNKTVKFVFPYPWDIYQQMPGHGNSWGDYSFIKDDMLEDCDFLMVFENTDKEFIANCPPENIIFFAGEPPSTSKYPEEFLEQFSYVFTCIKEMKHNGKIYRPQGHPWFPLKSYDELKNAEEVKKTKTISLVVSDKQLTDGQKKRYDFAIRLKEKLGDAIDLHGRGIAPFEDKWEVLAPYRYSVAIENSFCENYFSEKLHDCYLSHTFPFYYGCPNLEKYFDPDSFKRIDISDFDGALKTIEDTLADKTHYERHIEILKAQKIKYLDGYNIFPFIVNFIEEKKLYNNKEKKKNVIYPKLHFYRKAKK